MTNKIAMAKPMVTLLQIKDRHGEVLDGTKADIIPGHSIRVYGTHWAGSPAALDFSVTFLLGGEAVHGSYNLIYTGKIIRITEKTVTIEEAFNPRDRPHGKRHQLSIYDFARRNYHYDAEEIAEHNQEAARSI